MSLPSRERGLKSPRQRMIIAKDDVAPFAGARIEILIIEKGEQRNQCRSLRGSAD